MTPEQRQQIFARDMYTCQRCGATPGISGLQIAHKMHQGKQTENWIIGVVSTEYGVSVSRAWVKRNVVDHAWNVATSCPDCNSYFNLLFKRVEAKKLLDRILKNVID